ncbi:cysteine/serine-rich nuclear protein 3-like [Thalassophryne amazonica]|uniref:cysteine/serine-rich nuclear protein 3-like n=1 Tax=Thalassophryne amazonica TaxID=390379 RepID=UPI0014713AC3|nr:cysteine/serine-rich nuclear protein 3-like [Thalassophryne amazonica]
MSGQPKRTFDEVHEDPCCSSPSSSSSATLGSSPSNPSSPATNFTTSILKKSKKIQRTNVTFGQVTVFSFPRCQSFITVPSQAGCTLGMMPHHSTCHRYTLPEFVMEQQSQRRQKLLNRLKEDKLEALKWKLTNKGTQKCQFAEQLTVNDIPESWVSINDVNPDEVSFPLAYPPNRRSALLKAAGVQNIDMEEETQLENLRISRLKRGCDCQGVCQPETCSCSLAGIKCHVKRSASICGCTKDGCGNTKGRIQSNPIRVQDHCMQTLLRLKLEKRLKESRTEKMEEGDEEYEDAAEAPLLQTVPCSHPRRTSPFLYLFFVLFIMFLFFCLVIFLA